MADDDLTLLCTGDIHIGRRPSRLPEFAEGRRHAASQAWLRVVDTAIRQRVDAVVLTGDIVDQANEYYEAVGPLEEGIRRLAEKGIETFAVAGNHDYNVFPELVDSLDLDAFHLLGEQGQWTRAPLGDPSGDDPRVYLDGWSFPRRRVTDSPLDAYDHSPTDVPVLGVLHADLDQTDSPYAPVQTEELARAGPDTWLLGHIHHPDLKTTDTGTQILYPGSPQALDPGEIGLHGPWLIEIDPAGDIQAEQLPTATVRYQPLEVNVDGLHEEDQIRGRIHERIREAARDELGPLGELEHLVCRLKLSGRTKLHRELPALTRAVPKDLELTIDQTTATVDKIKIRTGPAFDLERLAEQHSPPGMLARMVLALDNGDSDEELGELLSAAEERIRKIRQLNTYAPVLDHQDLDPVETEHVRNLVRQQALLLIDELDHQQRGKAR